MTTTLRQRLAKTEDLAEALKIIASEPGASGALKISSGSTNAELAFADGHLTGAVVHTTGDKGRSALLAISAMRHVKIKYAKFADKAVPASQKVSMSIADALESLMKADDHEANKALNELKAADFKQEFHETDTQLEPQEDLSAKQKETFEFLANHLKDDIAFDQGAHPDLDASRPDSALEAKRQRLKDTARTDDRSILEGDDLMSWDVPSLTPKQREKLNLAGAAGRDLKTFEEVCEYFKQSGVELTKKQTGDLQRISKARTAAEQAKEFAEHGRISNEAVARPEQVTPDKPESPATTDDANSGPTILAEDRIPLVLMAPAPQAKAIPIREGIIWRPIKFAEKISQMLPEPLKPRKIKKRKFDEYAIEDTGWPIGECVALILFGALVVGYLVVPTHIIASTTDDKGEKKAKQHLSSSMHSDQNTAPPAVEQEVLDPPPKGASTGPTGPGGAPGADAGGQSSGKRQLLATGHFVKPESDRLRFAKLLASEGKTELAIPHFEQYLQVDSESIEARIHLIRAYIHTRDLAKARELCLATLKKPLTEPEIDELWTLLRECQVD